MPHIDLAHVRANTDGLANDVYIADERLVFRFAKNEQGRADLARERLILDLIRARVPVSVPSCEPLGDDAVVYLMIQGALLYRHDLMRLDESGQDVFAAQLGAFLQELHCVTMAELAEHGLDHALPGSTRSEWLKRFDRAEEALHLYLWADQKAWMADLFAPVREGWLEMNFTPVLIHNDLASYHILVEKSTGAPTIAGVIDFGVAGAGDPAADFAALISSYGESFVRRMALSYPDLDALLDRARLRAGYIELEWAIKGVNSNDLSWWTAHIGRAQDIQPIGNATLHKKEHR
jgi:aminoglycoside 2''-phosphotransferase